MPDEAIGLLLVQSATEPHRVRHRLFAMIERVRDRVVQHPREARDERGTEVAADDVAPERQRKTARALGPPLAEVHDFPQSLLGVRELPFVDEETRAHRARVDGLLNRSNGITSPLDVRCVQPQREERRREGPGNRHPHALESRPAALRATRATGP